MADQALLQQFSEELGKSPNFKYLSPEEQERIKAKYATATDEEVRRGIEIVKKDTVETTAEIERLVAEKKAAEAKRRLEAKEQMKEHERLEAAESEAKSREILQKLMEVETQGEGDEAAKSKDDKRKKFLGLF